MDQSVFVVFSEWSPIDLWLPVVAVAVISYLLGCFNGSVIVSKYILRDDIRNHGSGNAGLTNFYRTFGGPLTLVVISTDMLKAVAAVLTGMFIFQNFLLDHESVILVSKYWAAVFCLLGHMFPCMFHFRGGKGILSGGTVAIMIDWRLALLVWGAFIILVLLTRYVSLGSCIAGALFPVGTWFLYGSWMLTLFAFVIGGGLVFMHRGNIGRLLNGTESKFSLRKKKT